jgi:hypothetical protein
VTKRELLRAVGSDSGSSGSGHRVREEVQQLAVFSDGPVRMRAVSSWLRELRSALKIAMHCMRNIIRKWSKSRWAFPVTRKPHQRPKRAQKASEGAGFTLPWYSGLPWQFRRR